MRDELMNLVISAKRDDPETCGFTEWLVDYLIGHDVVIRQWFPASQPPPELLPVLAWSPEGGGFETARWTGTRWEATWDHEEFWGVTRWMYLPLPPEEA